MKKYAFKTADYVSPGPREMSVVSETIPDQSMSMRELLNRHSRGLPLGGRNDLLYDDEDTTGVDYSHLDYADQERFREARAAELKAIQFRQKETERRKKEAAEKKRNPPTRTDTRTHAEGGEKGGVSDE